jgi:chromosome segregation ATPase
MVGGSLQVVFLVQLVLVSLVLVRAVLRTRTMRPTRRRTVPRTGEGRSVRSRRPADRPVQDEQSELLEDVARLVAERDRLEQKLAQLHDQQTREEASFRERERAALLALNAYRRATRELVAAEPLLSERIDVLRVEVAHLEQRRDALREEVAASTKASLALRERIAHGRPELDVLRRERDQLRRRLIGDGQRLRDLAHRRALLRAETEELAAELELLQQLVDQPLTLVRLSDGELRAEATRREPGISRPDAPAVIGVTDMPPAPFDLASGQVPISGSRRSPTRSH